MDTSLTYKPIELIDIGVDKLTKIPIPIFNANLTATILPNVTTNQIINITSTGATSGGDVISNSSYTATVLYKGICWSIYGNPNISNSRTIDGSGDGTFTSYMTGLTYNTTYYVRAYATNSDGTSYGNERNFITDFIVPTVTTNSLSIITHNSVVAAGTVTSSGGTTTTRGFRWALTPGSVIYNNSANGTGIGSFTNSITGLTSGTTYYVKAYATNIKGSSTGSELSFTTLGIPSVTTTSVSNINNTGATFAGEVTSIGGTSVVAGFCWSTTHDPTIADDHSINSGGLGVYTANITGLTSGTTYYMKAYATNSVGTSYGSEEVFVTVDIGDEYQGGILFYITDNGVHGYVSNTADSLIAYDWGCNTINIVTNTAIGDGEQNTTDIINRGCPDTPGAADYCYNLTHDGYSDWFLPSKDELNQMYVQKDVIGGFDDGPFATQYISSSEYDANPTVRVWCQYFFNGVQDNMIKTDAARVRAIRYF